MYGYPRDVTITSPPFPISPRGLHHEAPRPELPVNLHKEVKHNCGPIRTCFELLLSATSAAVIWTGLARRRTNLDAVHEIDPGIPAHQFAMYFDQGEQRELKVGRMLKRAQGKSKVLSQTNWKERVFVLTPSSLRYFEGTNEVGIWANYANRDKMNIQNE